MNAARLLPLLALLAAFVAPGCGMTVETDWDPSADFAAVRTWDWVPEPQAKTGDPRLDSDLLARRVRDAVEDALEQQGLAHRPGGEVDVLVGWHVGLETKLDVDTFYTGYGARYGAWGAGYRTDTTVRQYEQGTLLIDLLAADDRRLLWRGSTSARIHEGDSPEQRDRRVREAVAAILGKYPPGAD